MKPYWKIKAFEEVLKVLQREKLKSKITMDEEVYQKKVIKLMKEAEEWGRKQGEEK